MRLRGFWKGFVYGGAICLAFLVWGQWYWGSPISAFDFLAYVIGSAIVGAICGLLAIVMGKIGRPRG